MSKLGPNAPFERDGSFNIIISDDISILVGLVQCAKFFLAVVKLVPELFWAKKIFSKLRWSNNEIQIFNTGLLCMVDLNLEEFYLIGGFVSESIKVEDILSFERDDESHEDQ